MIKKKMTSLALALLLLLQLFNLSSCSSSSAVTVYDINYEVLATLGSMDLTKQQLQDPAHKAYLEIVLNEAVDIIAETNDCSIKKAKKLLFKNQYEIYTSFSPTVFKAMQTGYTQQDTPHLEFGCAATDLRGNLLAVFSADPQNINRATLKTPAYSAFKPLSVYAPAIDAGIANWSTVFLDAPVKQIVNESGTLQDWPQNPAGTYAKENITVHKAIQKSLNTVAVRCLQKLGVQNSIAYLKENFNIDLTYEEEKANLHGEEEILGNIALGYLQNGVSPVDMAGYYQAFVTGGVYIEPRAITEMESAGDSVYQNLSEEKQVMKETTAYLMNQLLQAVTEPNGTASEAVFGSVPVAGKTGTGEQGNWFVGLTPQYSVAVWHGNTYATNCAPDIFADIVCGFNSNPNRVFNTIPQIKRAIYCTQSGGLFGKGCPGMNLGYYVNDAIPAPCQGH